MNDARITGQPEFSSERSTLDELPPLRPLVQMRPPAWTAGQIAFVACPFLIVLGLYLILRIVNYSYAQLLFLHPVGIKMVILAFGSMLLGAVLYLAATFALNRTLLGRDDRRKIHKVVSMLVVGLHLILFVFPALFVVLVGPAVIQIMDNLGP
jgi:hypothetical protein